MLKKFIPVIALLLFASSLFSQIKFEKGYYITNENVKTQGLIKNYGWNSNPTSFEFKSGENATEEIIDISNAKEFGIEGGVKYERHTVALDRSPSTLRALTNNSLKPMLEEIIYLKPLVEGEANLYQYQDQNLLRFFYSTGDKTVQPLIYQRYLRDDDRVVEINTFRQQILDNLQCPELKDVNKLKYQATALTRHFHDYNSCMDDNYKGIQQRSIQEAVNLKIAPGLKFTRLEASYGSILPPTTFPTTTGLRFGLEAEFILPFHKNKWGTFLEPSYSYYKAEADVQLENYRPVETIRINYSSIELAFGLRHYMFLDDHHKIYVNAAYVLDFIVNKDLDLASAGHMELRTKDDVFLGVGYGYRNKLSLETRYSFNKDLIWNSVTWRNNYHTLSIILGYNLF